MGFWKCENEGGIPEPVWRRQVEKMTRLPPSNKLKNLITAFSLQRVANTFQVDKFGVVSACKPDISKRENFELLYEMLLCMKYAHYRAFAHLGFWDNLPKRCLFVPRIEREKVREFAGDYEQSVYIWGERGNWFCYDAGSDKLLTEGETLQIIGPDEDFLMYSRIEDKRSGLQLQLENIKKKQSVVDEHLRVTIEGIERKIADLTKIENDLFLGKF